MIQANELRIGNWVIDPDYKNIFSRVEQIRDNDIETNVSESLGYNIADPIPLTPYILEKYGFKNDSKGFALPDKMSLSLSVTKDGEYLPCWLDKALFPGATRVVKSLHQLQNLYFALTGQELPYSPQNK